MFDDFELSGRGGRPRQLTIFTRQTKIWRFTSAMKDVVIGGNTYTAAPITRSEIKQAVEKPQDQLTITIPYVRNPAATELPATQDLGNTWFPYVPYDRVYVTCLDYHAKDPDLETKQRWTGRVAQPKWNEKTQTLELTCTPRGSSDSNLRRGPKWQKTCWKTVYSTGERGCLLNPADYLVDATITAIDGLTISAAEFGTAPFNLAGGTFSWERDLGGGITILEARPIMAHTGTEIQVLYFGDGLAVGGAVTALPNCPGTWAACTAFGNTQHYGGFSYEPVEDPYNSQSMSWS